MAKLGFLYKLVLVCFVVLFLNATPAPAAIPDCALTNPSTCSYVPKAQTVKITPTAFANPNPACEQVTDNCASDIMVPTGSQTEWSSFNTHHKECVVVAACQDQALPQLTLTANPTTINAGASTSLLWTVRGYDSCIASASPTSSSFNGAIAPTNANRAVTPAVTTIYTLTCHVNATKHDDSSTVTVTVMPGGACASPWTEGQCVGGTQIASWTSNSSFPCYGSACDYTTSTGSYPSGYNNTQFPGWCFSHGGTCVDEHETTIVKDNRAGDQSKTYELRCFTGATKTQSGISYNNETPYTIDRSSWNFYQPCSASAQCTASATANSNGVLVTGGCVTGTPSAVTVTGTSASYICTATSGGATSTARCSATIQAACNFVDAGDSCGSPQGPDCTNANPAIDPYCHTHPGGGDYACYGDPYYLNFKSSCFP